MKSTYQGIIRSAAQPVSADLVLGTPELPRGPIPTDPTDQGLQPLDRDRLQLRGVPVDREQRRGEPLGAGHAHPRA